MKLGIAVAASALAASLFAVSPSSRAATGFVVASVEYVRIYDTSVAGLVPPRFGFTLTGVASAGSCPLWNGRILWIGNSKEAFFLVTSAQLTGRQVAVYFDDTLKVNSLCIARIVTTGDPPPQF
jgi:hypothetical protein